MINEGYQTLELKHRISPTIPIKLNISYPDGPEIGTTFCDILSFFEKPILSDLMYVLLIYLMVNNTVLYRCNCAESACYGNGFI